MARPSTRHGTATSVVATGRLATAVVPREPAAPASPAVTRPGPATVHHPSVHQPAAAPAAAPCTAVRVRLHTLPRLTRLPRGAHRPFAIAHAGAALAMLPRAAGDSHAPVGHAPVRALVTHVPRWTLSARAPDQTRTPPPGRLAHTGTAPRRTSPCNRRPRKPRRAQPVSPWGTTSLSLGHGVAVPGWTRRCRVATGADLLRSRRS